MIFFTYLYISCWNGYLLLYAIHIDKTIIFFIIFITIQILNIITCRNMIDIKLMQKTLFFFSKIYQLIFKSLLIYKTSFLWFPSCYR